MIAGPAVMETDLPLKLFSRGKVRDTYELGPDQLLMVATDRISAFDHVLPNGIPDRGKVLTQLSIFWFSQTDTFQQNHLISGMVPDLPPRLKEHRDQLVGPVHDRAQGASESTSSAWCAATSPAARGRSTRSRHTLAGEEMPPGLRQSEKLADPIFSPATKAETGHDENITFAQLRERARRRAGATKLRDASLELYKFAAELRRAPGPDPGRHQVRVRPARRRT